MPPKKTYKRETAWSMLLAIFWVIYVGNIGLLEVIIWPFVTFIFAAFGMDFANKQTDLFTKSGKSHGEDS